MIANHQKARKTGIESIMDLSLTRSKLWHGLLSKTDPEDLFNPYSTSDSIQAIMLELPHFRPFGLDIGPWLCVSAFLHY